MTVTMKAFSVALLHVNTARLVLATGLLAHILIFLRLAVLFAPAMYLGPFGADRLFYYAYVRSLVFDGDLDFTNEIALHPPSSGLVWRNGKPLNKYPLGAPLLALPAYTAMHAVMRVWSPPGTISTGYEPPYVYAYALSQFAFAMLGMGLLYLILCRYTDPFLSAIGVVGASLSTELLRYTTADLLMSHAASSFSIAWCLFESLRLRDDPTRPVQWLRTGAAAAFMVMVRLQSGLFLLIPMVAVCEALYAMRTQPVACRMYCLGASTVGGLLVASPQLIAWRVMFGTWIANSYSGQIAFTWLAPHLLEVGMSLTKWLPLLVLGLWTTAVLAWQRRMLLLITPVVCTLGMIYVTASWWAFDIVQRTTFDNLAPIAIGLTMAAAVLRRVRPSAVWLALVLPTLWNVPFMMLYDSESGFAGLFGMWSRGLALFLGLS